MKYIIANWKSHKNLAEVKDWFDNFNFNKDEEKEVIIASPFVSLSLAQELLPAGVKLATQDISSFPAGAYTGAVSALNLQGLDVQYSIVGHSERRRYFHESHIDVANKVAQCLENNITPIVCVDDEYITDQAHAIEDKYLTQCIVAYEDLSAIGTGHNMPLESVLKAQELIKSAFGDVRVIYGGSVTPENARDYLDQTDGVLVGGASLDAEKFKKIVENN